MSDAPRVRHAQRTDLPRILELVAEHAAYERAAPPAEDLDRRLTALLFDTPTPRLRCLVAELPGGAVVGYATCAPEISTWEGREYLHMDCLFLRSGHRGLGLGAMLMDAVTAEARTLGLTEVQWQTPVWNEGAARFYDRLGAHGKEKLRYSLRPHPENPSDPDVYGPSPLSDETRPNGVHESGDPPPANTVRWMTHVVPSTEDGAITNSYSP